jgi:hypothetical protein
LIGLAGIARERQILAGTGEIMKSSNRAPRAHRCIAALSLASLLASGAFAQTPAAPPVTLAAVPAAPAPVSVEVSATELEQPALTRMVLPANTEILLSMNEELNTKRNVQGDTFYMTVVHDAKVGEQVAIPKGARAAGEITWRTGKGAFGKSGKMDIALRYVEVQGQRLPLVGTFRQEGEGNTVGTVAGVVAAGVFAAFITGKSGIIPRGRELAVHTKDDLVLNVRRPSVLPLLVATPAAAATASSDVVPAATETAVQSTTTTVVVPAAEAQGVTMKPQP